MTDRPSPATETAIQTVRRRFPDAPEAHAGDLTEFAEHLGKLRRRAADTDRNEVPIAVRFDPADRREDRDA